MARAYVEQREGGYYVAGTRVSLDSLVHGFWRGESPETIVSGFEVLTLEEVYGAIAFYLGHQDEVDQYLREQDDSWARDRADAPPLPAQLRERMARARANSEAVRRP
ncbi:MAG: DUF433 domain-containing protein [Bryobacterales bacterium]|nr:DUF433 domain-containing protein [Bryobacterales bacterium]